MVELMQERKQNEKCSTKNETLDVLSKPWEKSIFVDFFKHDVVGLHKLRHLNLCEQKNPSGNI